MPNAILPNIHELTPGQLQFLEESIDAFLFKQAPSGEPYHKWYRGNKFIFKKVIRETVRLQNNLKRYFKSQAEALPTLINMHLIKADDIDIYIDLDSWAGEDQRLLATIEVQINGLFDLGATMTELNFNQESGIDHADAPQVKFLRQYNFNLVSNINETTRQRIKQQIITSIQVGENRQQLQDRLYKVVNNPIRARMIAQTESIRAFSSGRFAVGKELGVKEKMWLGSQASDDACGRTHGEVVGIDEQFQNGVMYPPAHPNCRCSIKLILDGSEEITRNIDPSEFYST